MNKQKERMSAVRAFFLRKPFLAGISLLLLWFIVAGMFVFLLSRLSGLDILDTRIQNGGRLFGVLLLGALVTLTRWVDPVFLLRPGGWRAWLLTALFLVYIVFAGNYAYFGEVQLNLRYLSRLPAAREIIATQILVGLVEEMLFRGIILSVFLGTWGKTRRGVLVSFALSALFFALPHLIHLATVQNTEDLFIVLLNVGYNFVSGVWLAALVYRVRSVYPTAVLHMAGDAAIMLQGLTSQMPGPLVSYGRLALVELALVVVLIGLSWKRIRLPDPRGGVDRSAEEG